MSSLQNYFESLGGNYNISGILDDFFEASNERKDDAIYEWYLADSIDSAGW